MITVMKQELCLFCFLRGKFKGETAVKLIIRGQEQAGNNSSRFPYSNEETARKLLKLGQKVKDS